MPTDAGATDHLNALGEHLWLDIITRGLLLASQSEKIEEMLWISLRMFEERKNLLTSMTEDSADAVVRGRNRQQAREIQGYIDRIRAMLLDPRSDRPEDTLTHVKALMAEPRKAKSTR